MSPRAKLPKTVCDGARKITMPAIINPMLATLIDQPFSDPEWIFETKWDGVRAICFINKGAARFVSRNQIDMTHQYPELATIAEHIKASNAILDGEVVALDQHGVSRFQLLQPRLGRKNEGEIRKLAAKSRLAYYAFDLLYLDGHDLTRCSLIDRKATLEKILKQAKNVRYSDHIIGAGKQLYEELAKIPLEGMIAKRAASIYIQRRSADWLKVKTVQQMEVVIGGYTQPRKSREYFGAIVVGLYLDGKLHYVGHTGGGFNQKTLEQVYRLMQPLKTAACPFVEKPKTNEPVQWVKPKLVAQVKFSEMTADLKLRQPIFLGLREDKKPEECTLEVKRNTAQVVKSASKSKR